jgi:type II restriction enzyme
MQITQYINPKKASKQFKNKPEALQQLINETLHILVNLGIPSDRTPRRLERMAMAFLAVANVKDSKDWPKVEDETQGRSLRTREIIEYVNANFGEQISSGSYDDIRRKDLKMPVLGGIIVQTKPDSARNDSTRGYALSSEYASLIRQFGQSDWEQNVKEFLKERTTLAVQLSTPRSLTLLPVTLPSGLSLEFTTGKHNELQKAIIEQFLPRYGYGAELLYVGDAANKFLFLEKEKLESINFFELSHGELPDIIAYSHQKNWLYLIEAVHTSGPISDIRLLELKNLTQKCTAEIIYVTAFLTKGTFRKFSTQIAWETEVWIAESPDHLIHFDGEKFMGPFQK